MSTTQEFAARIAEALEDGGIGVADAFHLWSRGDRPAIRPATLLANELAEWLALEREQAVEQARRLVTK